MTASRKVLVVDDDPVVTESFEQAFSDKQYTVVAASSGEEALWRLGNEAFDAVFTELDLRGMGGIEVAEEIHAQRAWLPVILVADPDAAPARERTEAAGVIEVLRKPLSAARLAAIAERVVAGAASLPALESVVPATEALPAPALSFLARLRDVVLFILAPFLALIYILTFPIFGAGMLIWFAVKAREAPAESPPAPAAVERLQPEAPAKSGIVKTVAMLFVAVVMGIAYGLIAPILGIALIFWFGFDAWGKLGARAVRARQT